MQPNSNKCPICKERIWAFASTHTCPPEFDVFNPDYKDEDDTPDKVYAVDIERAVDKYCQQMFSNWEYPQSFKICIKSSEGEDWKTFEVEVQPVPEFILREVGK